MRRSTVCVPCLHGHSGLPIIFFCIFKLISEDNIKVNVGEISLENVEWICLARGWDKWQAVVNAVMNPQVSYSAGNFLTSCGTVSFLKRTPLH
jgi:hypothetical protein